MDVSPRIGWVLVGLLVFPLAATAEETRNPFGVADIEDPQSEAAYQLAEQVVLPGNKEDPNAEAWTEAPVKGNPMFLDGEWFGRWRGVEGGGWHVGTTEIRTDGDRIFILHHDRTHDLTYLLDLLRDEKNRLVGSYRLVGETRAGGVWAGLIVDGERIDGCITPGGARWDFRRNAQLKLPEKKRSN